MFHLSHFHSLPSPNLGCINDQHLVSALSLLIKLSTKQHLHFPLFLQFSYTDNSSVCHHLQNRLGKEITEASFK